MREGNIRNPPLGMSPIKKISRRLSVHDGISMVEESTSSLSVLDSVGAVEMSESRSTKKSDIEYSVASYSNTTLLDTSETLEVDSDSYFSEIAGVLGE